MANRDYKNIKRFVDGISKEVETTMEGGGSGSGKIYHAQVTWGSQWRYSSSISFPCTDPSVQDFDSLVAWLKKCGYSDSYENTLPFVPYGTSVFTTEARSGADTGTDVECMWVLTKADKSGNKYDIICLKNVQSGSVSTVNSLYKEQMPSDFTVAVSE